jgi:hypothetical protein
MRTPRILFQTAGFLTEINSSASITIFTDLNVIPRQVGMVANLTGNKMETRNRLMRRERRCFTMTDLHDYLCPAQPIPPFYLDPENSKEHRLSRGKLLGIGV